MSIDSLFDEIFVIHLSSLAGRRKTFEQAFRDIGCEHYEVFEAVDGAGLDLGELKINGQLVRCDDQDRELFPGEVGCFLSHAGIWQQIIDSGIERALVCEDDITFTDEAIGVFPAAMAEVPAGWDIVHFHSHVPLTSDRRTRTRVSQHIWIGDDEGNSTLCYAITNRCASYFLEYGFPIRNPVDGVTNWPTSEWCKDYRGYVCDPFPCLPSGADSAIGDKYQRRTVS